MVDLVVNDWGLYPWFEEHGVDLIHPDDLYALRDLFPYGKLFKITGFSAKYLKVLYADREYRVVADLFKPVPTPPVSFFDCVGVRREGIETTAVICDINWHFQKKDSFYYLMINNKRLSKRYWYDDFIRIKKNV